MTSNQVLLMEIQLWKTRIFRGYLDEICFFMFLWHTVLKQHSWVCHSLPSFSSNQKIIEKEMRKKNIFCNIFWTSLRSLHHRGRHSSGWCLHASRVCGWNCLWHHWHGVVQTIEKHNELDILWMEPLIHTPKNQTSGFTLRTPVPQSNEPFKGLLDF